MIKKRLDLIISTFKLSGRKFEKECGLTNGSYASITDGIGADKLNKILVRFPEISAEWLLTGMGSMLKGVSPPDLQIANNEDRLLGIIESQQRAIENLSKKV